MITELLLSSYINVESGVTTHITQAEEAVAKSFASYFAPHTGDQHEIQTSDENNIEFKKNSDVICMIHSLSGLDQARQEELLDKAWASLNANGLLIVHDVMPAAWHQSAAAGLHSKLESFGVLSTYSALVASKIEDDVEISHYSTIQEAKLLEERQQQSTVFKVIQKN